MTRRLHDGPVARLPVDGPVARLPVDGPAARLPVDGPAARLPVDGPAARRRFGTAGWPIAAVAAAAVAAAAPVAAADYRFDPTHTTVHVDWTAPGALSTVRVRWARVGGALSLDRSARRGRVDVAVAAAALDTGVPALDERLRGPGGLDSARFGRLAFAASDFRFDGDRLVAVAGTLTLRGRDVPLTLQAVRFACYTSPLFRREVCGGDFEAALDGAAIGADALGALRLRVQVEAIAS